MTGTPVDEIRLDTRRARSRKPYPKTPITSIIYHGLVGMMRYTLAYHKAIATDKGVFNGSLFHILTDLLHWIWLHSLLITEHGQLFSTDENDNHFLLLHALQLCHVQIYPLGVGLGDRIVRKKNLDPAQDDPPVIFIKTFENEKLYIRVTSKQSFGNLISALVVWLSLKPQGLAKKWYAENKVAPKLLTHEVLVCRFKVYGPIPHKLKNLNIVPGPKAPVYQPRNADHAPATLDPTNLAHDVNEGWFYTMGVLKSNGKLNFISELDGTLLYSLDVCLLLLLEIREVHNLIFDSSNVLFIGYLKELRFNNVIKTTNNLTLDQYYHLTFLTRDGKPFPNNQRMFIEFPLHIDLEDWFVGLNYFSKREYIGLFLANTVIESPPPTTDPASGETKPNSHIPHSQLMPSFARLASSRNLHDELQTKLTEFSRDNFKVSKRLTLDIIEARLELALSLEGKIYAEVRMWGLPWSRTAVVNYTLNPFWKEEFSAELPILTQMIHILIKKCLFSDLQYSQGDKVIGTVYVTPDILANKPNLQLLTIAVGGAQGNNIKVQGILAGGMLPGNAFANINADIVRLLIYDALNIPIGKLLIQVKLKEYHILPPANFKPLEKMLLSAPMKDIIEYCNNNVASLDFEEVSLILLDVFQLLGVEESWFKALMEAELINVDKITRKNYISGQRRQEKKTGLGPPANVSSSNNVFNTLFRGLLIFSKSLERYNLRIGQEYLEKVFSDFFNKIADERLNCEVDPRYVRLQARRRRRHPHASIDVYGDELDSELDSDALVDTEEEDRRDAEVKQMIEENMANLNSYCEEIWQKIYMTLNDLPEQIKLQLKNFRVKVELACDPDDKTTALNCLLAFIFLRFFCPAILNPKLFHLTKNHQTGTTQRTLTLIAKVLLNLANRQQFLPHKEPHLVPLNAFLEKETPRVFEYFDKITGRKNDFNKKILDLLHEVKRFDLGLQGDTLNELPTTPYLIDKYLRLTELVHLLTFNSGQLLALALQQQLALPLTTVGNDDLHTISSLVIALPSAYPRSLALALYRLLGSEVPGELRVDDDVYQIGLLEFEKLEFLDLAGDDETEGFIKLLCRADDNIFSFIALNITLKDLQKSSAKLMNKVHDLETYLENGEFPGNYFGYHHNNKALPSLLWEAYTNDVLSRCYLDTSRCCLVFLDQCVPVPPQYKRLVDNALMLLKLKFPEGDPVAVERGIPNSFSTNLLSSVKSTSRNPLKKWFRRNPNPI